MEEEDSAASVSLRIPSTSERTVTDALGARQSCSVLGRLEWVFLLVSLINIVTCSSLTIDRIVIYAQYHGSPDFTFALVLLISCLFSAFYVINGLFREHQYEIYAFIAAILLVMAYCVLEYIFHVEGRTPVKLTRMIAACVVGPPNILLAVIVARRFGWLQFRIIGASNTLLHMYSQLKRYRSLQNFDLQASGSMLILCMNRGTALTLEDKLILSIGSAYSLLWFLMGFIAVRREIRWLVWTVAILGLIMPGYVVYQITEVYKTPPPPANVDLHPDDIIRYSVLGVGALAFVVRFVLLAELEGVYRNFGHGLREKAFSRLFNEKTNLLQGSRRNYDTGS